MSNPVDDVPARNFEIDGQDWEFESVDLDKAELWANRLLDEYWDCLFPVDPNAIAVKMGMDVYFVPIPGGLAGLILKGDQDSVPSIFVDEHAATSRKRFTIAHEIGHYIERFKDSEPSNQLISGYLGFSDESMVSDEKILAGRIPTTSGQPDRSPKEMFADHFAHNLLMPEDEVQRFIGLGMSIETVATYFGVSAITMRNRLNSLGIDL